MKQETNEQRIRYLEIIQNIIDRMARCSFHLKEWTIVVESALLGLSVSIQKSLVLLIAIIPALIFWILDSYYLQQERGFRHTYSRNSDMSQPIFSYAIKIYLYKDNKNDKELENTCFCRVLFSFTELPYVIFIGLLIITILILHFLTPWKLF